MRPDADAAPAGPPLAGLARWLVARWYGAWPVWTLLPLSLLFALVTAVRRTLFRQGLLRSTALPVPVLVVGNLVAGGAGKTPTVIAVVEGLRARGWHPGVLSRGYGGQQQAVALVQPDSPARTCGDEAVLLARRLQVPLAIGRNRPAAGRALLAAHPQVDCLVCDDGLQHYALQRDVELVVIDRARGLGNGWLLPAGPLREPAGRLRDVSGVIIHGEAPVTRRARRLQQRLDRLPSVATLALAMQAPRSLADGRTEDWPAWQGRTVHAVAGIGHPERFFAGLRHRGITVLAHPFPDHHAFTARDLQFAGHHPVLLTEKDAVKCSRLPDADLWEVPLQSGLPSALLNQLSNQLESARGRKTA